MTKTLHNLLLLLLATVFSFSSVFAQEKTWTFGWEKSRSAGGEGFYDLTSHDTIMTTTLNQLTWMIVSDTYYFAFTANTGQLVGGATHPASWLSLYTNNIPGKVKSIEVTARKYDDATIAAKLQVEVNGVKYKVNNADEVALSGTFAAYKFVPAAEAEEGKVDIQMKQTSELKKTLYFRRITIVYEEEPSEVKAPIISLASGTYDKAQQVSLVTPYAAGVAKIFYTTDGSNPKIENGTRMEYIDTVTVSSSCRLNAVTLKDGVYSTVSAANYVIRVAPGIFWDVQEYSVEAGDNDYGPYLNNPNKVSPIVYKSSNENVAVVNNMGYIFSIKEGMALVAAIFKGNETYLPDTAWYMLNVKAKEPIPAPVISPAGGRFDAPVTVTISGSGVAKAVWYSTTAVDYNDLLDHPTIVAGQNATVTIDESCTLSAVAVDYNNVSTMTTAQFVIGEPTGVTDIVANKRKSTSRSAYAIDGRRVNNPQSGLYIVNGKKVIVE